MSGDKGSKWRDVRNVQNALRSFQNKDDQIQGQPRGWEREREGVRPPANDPPLPSRPPYGYQQHYPSDPGLHNGLVPWQSSPPPQSQGSPPSQYSQHYQGQYQTDSRPQGYGPPPPPNPYQPTHPQGYGQSQGYMYPSPQASNSSYNPAYQQQHMTSTSQSYQGGQVAYPYLHRQTTGQPANNANSPPLPPHPDSQDSHRLSQSPNSAGQSYQTQSGIEPLTRSATAPANWNCQHRYPGDGL